MNYVYIATSIDGFIAKKDGDIDWLHEQSNPTNDDYGYSEFMKNIDALVMGRNTFEKVRTLGEWPYEKKVFVLSSVLKDVPDDLVGKMEFISGKPKSILNHIYSLGLNNLYIDGGSVVQSFLAEDLIDEIIITRIPILLGDGLPLFGKLADTMKFKHENTKVYDNALVKSHYVRER